MRIGRVLPPAAAPLEWIDVVHAFAGQRFPARAIAAFEEEIRRYFDVKHVFLVSSGTAALVLALRALRSLSGRSEVVIPAYTCYSVPAAVIEAGLRPVLCDITVPTFDFDHASLPGALTPDTLCVIAHHLYGVPCDVDRTRALCRERGVLVVEDAAQAMGVRSHGRRLGTLGDVGIFSLGRGKNITCGSGGIIVTRSAQIASALAREYEQVPACSAAETLRELARVVLMMIMIRPRLYWMAAALPFLRLGQTIFPRTIRVRRLSAFKAGMLRNWRRHLLLSNRTRSEAAAYFHRRMPERFRGDAAHPYLRLPLLAATPGEKERLHAFSRKRGLGLSGGYPAPLNEIPQMRPVVNGQPFPRAREVADRLLTIPTHHWVSERDRKAIADLCLSAGAS